jgi:hypothetical protein
MESLRRVRRRSSPVEECLEEMHRNGALDPSARHERSLALGKLRARDDVSLRLPMSDRDAVCSCSYRHTGGRSVMAIRIAVLIGKTYLARHAGNSPSCGSGRSRKTLLLLYSG